MNDNTNGHDNIKGHINQRQKLGRLLTSGRLHSTLLFSGPEGVGKQLVARELLQSLACEIPQPLYGGCRECKSCHLFETGNYPDFHFLECSDNKTWSTPNIRKWLGRLNLKSFNGRCRVVIFNNAEKLHISALNALLKTLEEPLANTWFCLISSNPSRLPITIRSRSQAWSFGVLQETEIREIINNKFPSTANLPNLPELLTVADGSMSELLSFSGETELQSKFRTQLLRVYSGKTEDISSFSQSLGTEKAEKQRNLHLLRVIARQEMLEADEDTDRTRWAVCVSNLIEAERFICERNINPKAVMSSLLLELLPSKTTLEFSGFSGNFHLLSELGV